MGVTYHTEIHQGDEAWFDVRRGLITASEMKLIMTPKNLSFANNDKSRAHVLELAAQRVSGYTEPSYVGDDMLRGWEEEIYARQLYSEKFYEVVQVGFVTNDKWGFTIGYSPDGLVGDDGLIEVKSRRQKYQVQTIIEQEVPEEYKLQLQTGLLVTEHEWCDFISYHGGLPMYVHRVFADEKLQEAIVTNASLFEKQVQEAVDRYKKNSKQLIPTIRKSFQDWEVKDHEYVTSNNSTV